MNINTKDYLSFKNAVALSKRHPTTFIEHVMRGNIQFVEFGDKRFYLKKDVEKLAAKPKQPHTKKVSA